MASVEHLGTQAVDQLDAAIAESWFDRLAETLQGKLMTWQRASGTNTAISNALNGTWLGHSLHATATDVTIGTLLSSTLLDYVATAGRDHRLAAAAERLLTVGVLSVPLTAAAGAADWQYEEGRGRRLGFVHALTNSTAAALFVGSLLARRGAADGAPPRSALALSSAGLLVLLGGAYLGGHLAFRFGIAVNRVAWVPPIPDFTPALPTDQLREGEPEVVELPDHRILLVRQSGQLFALDDACPHLGCSLARGVLGDGTITCPCHMSTFRLADGSIVTGPTTAPVHTYLTREQDGMIAVRSGQGSWLQPE